MCGVCPEEECFEGGVDCEDEAARRAQQQLDPEQLHQAETDLQVRIEGGHLRSVPGGEDEAALHEEEEGEAGLAAVERQRPKKVARAATRPLVLLGCEERDRIPLRGWIPRSSSLTTRCDSEERRRMRLL